MTSKFSILTLFLFLRFFLFGDGNSEHQPIVLVEGWDLSKVSSDEIAFTLVDDSTHVNYEVVLLEDADGLPTAYTSYITTPVCDDTLCALMHIQMYWNLLGNYIGFDTISGNPLTKNDHIKFMDEDYNKLHRLLMDDNSIIKRKEKADLFDDNIKRVSEVVDAVTGATAKEVKEAVVDGALYSSYTIYHIVYGAVSDSIRSDMERRYSKSLQVKLLSSIHPDYQLYALKGLDKSGFIEHTDRIIALIHKAIPLNRLYIMKKMPEEMWLNESVQNRISGFYGDLEVNSKSYFLKKMESLDRVSPIAVLNLVKHLEWMSQNQLKSYIRILSRDQVSLVPELVEEINLVLKKGNQHYGYLLEEFLRNEPSQQN